MDYKAITALLFPIASGELKPQLNGIYHSNGCLVASNAKILVEVKYKDYPKAFEGLTISQIAEDTSLLHGDYPDYRRLFTRDLPRNSNSKPSEYIYASCLKLFINDPDAAIEFDDIYLRPSDIIKVFDLIYLAFQEPTQMLFGSRSTPVIIKSKSVTAFIMPLIDVLDYYTPEEAFNLPPKQI